MAQSQRFGISGITETCSSESCDWNAPLDGYKLFRGYKQGRRGEGVALYVKEGNLWNSQLAMVQLRASG